MINPVTPWAATVQLDISNGSLIYEAKISDYKLKIYNSGDSIWLTADWQQKGSIAFKLAFGMNSNFEDVSTHIINLNSINKRL